MNNLVEISIIVGGQIIEAGTSKKLNVHLKPLGDPVIVGSIRENKERNENAVLRQAPASANAYVMGSCHPIHENYYPVQFYQMTSKNHQDSSH